MATQEKTLPAGAWTSLGVAPLFFQLKTTARVGFAVGDAPPASLDAPQHILSTAEGCDRSARVEAEGTVYARGLDGSAVVTITG